MMSHGISVNFFLHAHLDWILVDYLVRLSVSRPEPISRYVLLHACDSASGAERVLKPPCSAPLPHRHTAPTMGSSHSRTAKPGDDSHDGLTTNSESTDTHNEDDGKHGDVSQFPYV